MTYQVVFKREILLPEDHIESTRLKPETFEAEDLALQYIFSLLEGFRRHPKDNDILFQIQGPDGFKMEHNMIVERFRKWYWLKTGRLP